MTITDTATQTPKLSIPRIENMIGHNGDPVVNQFLIYTDNGVAFQSYSTVIAFKEYGGRVYLDEQSWDYGTTTGKYRNLFLGDSGKKETEKLIRDGHYILTNLNG